MNERFRRADEGAASTTDQTEVAGPDTTPNTETERTERRFSRDEHAPRAGIAAGTMRDVRARQREEFGGINWGASFFGWLSAAGLGAILAGIVSAAGATL